MTRLMVVYGTRPEAIKVAPVIAAARASEKIEPITVVTGQHREMLDQVNAIFGITPDLDLNIFEHGQGLADISSKTLHGVGNAIRRFSPDAVLVQGDTTTSTFAALAAFYERVPVVHLEAGLRTGDIYSPFPEEANRKITGQVTALHLAPTSTSRQNLLTENIDPSTVVVTGNSVIDALLTVTAAPRPINDETLASTIERLDADAPVLLVTTHRRENLGEPMSAIGRALARVAQENPDLTVLLPLHRNPRVRERVIPEIADAENIVLLDPLEYSDFTVAMARSTIVLTDSGGVQEEAPSLGKPVLVLRDNTERPEAVTAGTVRLIGIDEQRIIDELDSLLHDRTAYEAMAQATNPYGDGRAAERALAAVEALLGIGERLPDFTP